MTKNVISVLKKITEDGNAIWKHTNVYGRITTPKEDSYISLVAKRNRNATSSQIAAENVIAIVAHVSARTILWRLDQVGLYTRKSVRCMPLQLLHRRERLRWCKEHIDRGHQQWSRMMFCDEFVSLRQVILTSGYCEKRRKHITPKNTFVNVIGMVQACYCGPVFCIMAEHSFTSLREVMLHRSGIEERLFSIMLQIQSFCLWTTMQALDNDRNANVSNN